MTEFTTCAARLLLLLGVSACLQGHAAAAELTAEEAAALRAAGPAKVDKPYYTDPSPKLVIPDVPRDRVICFCLYTAEAGVLKLSAQLYPLREGEPRDVTLQIDRGAGWVDMATQPVDTRHWMTTFRVEGYDNSRAAKYRVTHAGGAAYEGTLRADPADKETVVVAAFTGNSNRDRGMREDIVRNVQAQDPDLLFFSGDQSYDHKRHYAAWLLFGRQFGEIIKDRPTVCIPDDHDVGQGNLWGAGGRKSTGAGGAADGGYEMPAAYVKMVERAQTAHLPDPVDPEPVGQGIGVYFTRLRVGGIDFAIIEDRKFKTGPMGMVPQQGTRPDHIQNPGYDPQSIDVPEAVLLGERQLRFLRDWGEDWDGAAIKCVLSQTIFAGGAHIHGKSDSRLMADMDSNGWPQAGRNRALRAMRKAYAFHIAGDQHLATVIHHGVTQWGDAGWSFCVPSIVNYYGRWWWPLEPPQARDATSPLPFTGRYYDGFRNKVTMHAYANPAPGNFRAAGYGIVRFNKPTRQITMECWPRHVDVREPGAQQFRGWPITIDQTDNYRRAPQAYLPTLKIAGADDAAWGGPVVQVVDEELGDVLYTLRIRGGRFTPPVFRALSRYTVRVTAGEAEWELTGIKPLKRKAAEAKPLQVAMP
ncbi:MAG: hypothetical protein AAF790_12035 [Planctomycetota bacterium]